MLLNVLLTKPIYMIYTTPEVSSVTLCISSLWKFHDRHHDVDEKRPHPAFLSSCMTYQQIINNNYTTCAISWAWIVVPFRVHLRILWGFNFCYLQTFLMGCPRRRDTIVSAEMAVNNNHSEIMFKLLLNRNPSILVS